MSKKKKISKWTPPTKTTFILTFLVWIVSLLSLIFFPVMKKEVFIGYILALLAWLVLALGILCEKI